jgi:hypothetical protein
MKFSTREDIDAPREAVFAHLTDFEAWERGALRRGAEVQRIDTLSRPGPGMSWKSAFQWRGKRRQMVVRLDRYDLPSAVSFSARASNIEAQFEVELLEMAARRTRVIVRLEIRPLTLTARLLLQTMKLARGRSEARFRKRVAQVAAEISARHGDRLLGHRPEPLRPHPLRGSAG